MGDSRLRFAQRLNEMSEELGTLAKEVEKNRKQASQSNSDISNIDFYPRPRNLLPDMSGPYKSQRQ